MRRRFDLVAMIVASAGCNQVLGLGETAVIDAFDPTGPEAPRDRDRDGIPDPSDPCIAGIADYKTDLEIWRDYVANEVDPCPFDYDPANRDGDEIYDECEPLLALPGDRRRCFMAFLNPTINRELWTPRGDPARWNLIDGILGSGTGVLIAGESFEGPTTTAYDLELVGDSGAVTLWLRTTEMGAPTDVGCEVRSEGSGTRFTILGTSPLVTQTSFRTLLNLTKIEAVVIANTPPGTKNVMCVLRSYGDGGFVDAISAAVVLPEGRVGFGVEGSMTTWFKGLQVLERDDWPLL